MFKNQKKYTVLFILRHTAWMISFQECSTDLPPKNKKDSYIFVSAKDDDEACFVMIWDLKYWSIVKSVLRVCTDIQKYIPFSTAVYPR